MPLSAQDIAQHLGNIFAVFDYQDICHVACRTVRILTMWSICRFPAGMNLI